MKKVIIWAVFLISASILLCQESIAGIFIEQVMKDKDGMASRVEIYFSGERLRTDHLQGGLTTIMDLGEDRMVMIDHRSRSYVEVKFSQWEKEVSARLKQEGPALSPKAGKITVRRPGETTTINRFKAEKIEIYAGGELIEESWVTRDVDMEGIDKLMERAARGLEMNQEGGEIHEKLKGYGFPVLVRDHAVSHGLGPVDVLEVKKIEKKELKDEVFAPPTGYRKIIPR
jgi:Domain of unknown function (DUF4412)